MHTDTPHRAAAPPPPAPSALRWATALSWERLRQQLPPAAYQAVVDCLDLASSYNGPGALVATCEIGGSAGPRLVVEWQGRDAWQTCGAHAYMDIDQARRAVGVVRAWWRDRERP